MKARKYIQIAVLFICLVAGAGEAFGQYSRYLPRPRTFALGLEGGISVIGCDVTDDFDHYVFEPYANLEFGYLASNAFKVGLYVGRGNLKSEDDDSNSVKNSFINIGITAHFYLQLRRSPFVPFVFIRVGGIFSNGESTYEGEFREGVANAAMFGGGVGFEVYPSRQLAIRIQGGGFWTTTDLLDRVDAGTMNDGFTTVTGGIIYYFNLRR